MKRRKKAIKILTFILVVSFIYHFSGGISYAENSGAAFLKIGVGARPVGMGNAYLAVANDVTAGYWNPAGLSYLTKRELSAMHTSWIADMNFNYIGYGHPMENGNGTIGIGIVHLDVGTMEGRDENRNKTGDFTAYDACATISYSRLLSSRNSLGINLKFIQQQIADERANGVAIDIGNRYELGIKNLNLGLAVQNIGPKMKFISEGYNLPLTLGAGLGYNIGGLTLGLDVKHQVFDNRTSVSFGTEYLLIHTLALRAGYLSRLFSGAQKDNIITNKEIFSGINGLGMGLGFRLGPAAIDYAFVPYGDLGDTHRLSLNFGF